MTLYKEIKGGLKLNASSDSSSRDNTMRLKHIIYLLSLENMYIIIYKQDMLAHGK